MSAPDLMKWEMTETEIETVQYNSDVYGVDSDEVQTPIRAVARRRALAELRALTEVYCDCGKNGGHGGHDADCQSGVIFDRIAAIEAEEA